MGAHSLSTWAVEAGGSRLPGLLQSNERLCLKRTKQMYSEEHGCLLSAVVTCMACRDMLSLQGTRCDVFALFMFFPRDDFNIKVLQAFVELHEFADLNLVQALR